MAIIELTLVDGYALLEHPGEPHQDPQAASIWRLPIVKALKALPNVQIVRFAQGLMGSSSSKPTNLLALNLPGLLLSLQAHRVRTEIPKATSIGKDQHGRWKTIALKEYTPSLCKCLASVLHQASSETPVNPHAAEPSEEAVAEFLSMVIHHYGEKVGADYYRHSSS